MRRPLVSLLICFALIIPSILRARAQITVDPVLAAEIARIKAIDNHAHPLQVVGAGETDTEETYVSALEPLDIPVRLRADNPEYIQAWRALYGYAYNDMAENHVRELRETKQRLQREQSSAYPLWVLDRLGIEMMFANRVAMGRGLSAPRFRWVPFADPLLFPLNNAGMGRPNPDYRTRYAGAERILKRYLQESGLLVGVR